MSRTRSAVPFSAIEKIDVRRRTSTATVVVIGPQGRLDEAGDALDELADKVDLRVVLISQAGGAPSSITVSKHAVEFDGLESGFVNNAVAALRLSNLPTFVWLRGGDPASVESLAALADRLVLDEEDPFPLWGQLPGLVSHSAVTDLRWTRLTRWRALLAHFFDMPQVRDRAAAFRRLTIAGADKPSAQLFAGWLSSALQWKEDATLEFTASGTAPIESLTLGDGTMDLTLSLKPTGCVESCALVGGDRRFARTVSLGDQQLGRLIAEELRIRSRDRAFERAVELAARFA